MSDTLSSHQFLVSLSQSQSAYCRDGDRLKSVDAARSSKRLVMVAEALSVEKAWAVWDALQLPQDLSFYMPSLNQRSTLLSMHVNLPAGINLARALLERVSAEQQVELALIDNPISLETPGLLLMDMDSTMIDCECIDDIAELAGVGNEVKAVTEQAMQGKLDFAQSLTQRVACLKGASQDILEQVRQALPLMPGMTELLRELKRHNWKVALASGGFTYFADDLQQRLGLDAAVANQLAIQDGLLTGKVDGAIVDAQVKAQTLQRLSQQYAVASAQTVAMGDGANDLPMLATASLGVAFHAKPVVAEQAHCQIRKQGLQCLLHFIS